MKYEEIVIEIEESLDANKNFKINNLLQTKAIEKIKKLVKNRLEKLEDSKKLNDRKHDVITILGERGTGKTSLLLNLETILEDSKDELVFLRIIDPTLFETKQNILVSIISLIADIVKDKATEEWSQSLVELGDGLKLLDGIGSDIIRSDLFDDGELILEKGLDHAHSGLNLEKNFNNFISKSLSLLDNKEMFVLVFDDIDTNIDKGWMVLETIRKYLTSSQLQVFVSGDWELFSSLVRMKQWENFDRKILPTIEWESKINLVDDLEEQYLVKVLKPEYRIYLENLYHLTTKSEYPTIYIKDNKNNKRTIDSIYQEISEKLFNLKNKEYQIEISKLIKFLPIRTNMKILYLFVQNQEKHLEMINEISNVFVTNTSRFNFTHLDYENLSINSVLQEMAKKLYLISNDKFPFSDLSQFPMNVSDKNLNLLLMVVNLHLTHTLNTNTYIFFEWLTSFTYLDVLDKEIKDADRKNELLDVLKYNYIISMNERINLFSGTYEKIMEKQKNSLLGFRKTYAFDRYAKDANFLGVDRFEKEASLDEKFLLNIVLSKTGKVAHSEQSSVSIINIFAFLADFLKIDIQDAEYYLFNLFQNLQENFDINSLIAEEIMETNKNDILNNNFYKSLLEWHKLAKSVEMFSLSQISRLWKEFISKHTSNISNNLQDKKFENLKDFLSSQIIVFLNLVITEILINKGEEKIYSSVNSTTNLYRNMKIAYGKDYKHTFYDKIDLFKFMYMCPILYCFLEDAEFIEPKTEYWIGKNNLNKIKTSFGKLGIHGGVLQEEKDSDNNELYVLIENFINRSDLRKVTYKDPSSIIKIIDQIKNEEIDSTDKLWNKIKPPRNKMTDERKAILNRFISNVKNSTIKTNDSSTN